MTKRKRTDPAVGKLSHNGSLATKKSKSAPQKNVAEDTSPISVQIVAGSYERVLHGLIAVIPSQGEAKFADNFLLNAHTSAIKCLAISPPSVPIVRQTQKVILASGSTDARVNLYHLSAHAPPQTSNKFKIPSLSGRPSVHSSQNKELGSLSHHGSSVSALYFPTRSKLLSAGDDSTIAITRTRDWSVISTIKAPIPKPQGRPSGDTAPLGGTPAGVTDFAVHPSMKLMISVGRGEKSMRLWNLVTGKKAGVLNFDRKMLSEVGEGRYASGEGRKVSWGTTAAGDEFCVGFDRGILVFGMDSKPRCKVLTPTKTKFHQLHCVSMSEDEYTILTVSTEDGRILFFSTEPDDLVLSSIKGGSVTGLPSARLVAQLGSQDVNLGGRIKDFKILKIATDNFLTIAASSDGTIRLWRLSASSILSNKDITKPVGELVGTVETGNRITCLEAFVFLPVAEDTGNTTEVDDEEDGEKKSDDSSSDSE